MGVSFITNKKYLEKRLDISTLLLVTSSIKWRELRIDSHQVLEDTHFEKHLRHYLQ